ncbi:MAG: radical SAM protein [bacterium]
MRILLLTPPMVQVNAPYPATAHLAGFLKNTRHTVCQADAALMLALRLFSRSGILKLTKAMSRRSRSRSVRHFIRHAPEYAATMDPAIRFLQGHDPTLALRIASRRFLPEGPRFTPLARLPVNTASPFGDGSTHDLAVYLASLYLDDVTDAIRDGVDSRFELARYAEKLAASAPSFDGIASALRRKPTLVDSMIDAITEELIRAHKPELVGMTLPFPGNVYGAFRMARYIKKQSPGTTVVMGGGYINTELRNLSEPRVFDYADFITLDDGERPLLRIIEHVENQKTPLLNFHQRHQAPQFERTFFRNANRVCYVPSAPPASTPRLPLSNSTPLFSGLPLDRYFSMVELPNPMHKIWSCGRWNKLALAHGCYWQKCAFCDTALDTINRYSPTSPNVLIERIETIIQQTGQTGFHFVDEAMPPALIRSLAELLIDRGLKITWWGNIRFDKAFTPDLAALAAQAGCVAVTGGLEAATDRLLSLLDKGFQLEQVTRVTHTLSEAGIMVHAYLMYGCPSQTCQETVDSLEYVRQLFDAGYIQSAYWHRFALTIHSPIYRNPRRFGIRIPRLPKPVFARNEVPFVDSIDCDHDALGRGLRKALYSYLHGAGLDLDLQAWFDIPVPPPTLHTDFVTRQA